MTPLMLSAWGLQFLFEVAGAWFAWRRRIHLLAAYLAFAAFAEIVTALILLVLGGNAYGFASWAAEGVSYILLGVLACRLAAVMLREWKPVWGYAAFISVGGATIVTVIVRHTEGWAEKFTGAEIAGSCYLMIMLLVAWVAREGRLERPWDLILAGIVTITGGNAACAWLFSKGLAGEGLYFIPELAGLALLCWAGWRDWRLEEFRRALPAKVESLWPESGELLGTRDASEDSMSNSFILLLPPAEHQFNDRLHP